MEVPEKISVDQLYWAPDFLAVWYKRIAHEAFIQAVEIYLPAVQEQ